MPRPSTFDSFSVYGPERNLMQRNSRSPLRAAALAVALLTALLVVACGDVSGEDHAFSFRAKITNVQTEEDDWEHKSTTITLEAITDLQGPGSSWFADPEHRWVYNDYYAEKGEYVRPGKILKGDAAIAPSTPGVIGATVTISGKLHTDVRRTGAKTALNPERDVDRPVYDRIILPS